MCLELILHTEKPFVFVSVCRLYLLAELVMSANNSRYADYMTLSDASVQTDRHTHVLSFCSMTLRCLTPIEYWVTTVSFPCDFWPYFSVYSLTLCGCEWFHVCALILLTLAKHWFLFLSAVGSAACHLYCFPSLSQRAESQISFLVGPLSISP